MYNFNYVSILITLCVGMKHREERVVGGEVKPTASMFGEEEEEDPQVLYDKVSSSPNPPSTQLLYDYL